MSYNVRGFQLSLEWINDASVGDVNNGFYYFQNDPDILCFRSLSRN